MPRSNKGTENTAIKLKAETEPDESLSNLEKFLIETYDWPDVTDILVANQFKEAMEQFSDIADFRAQLKESLAPCYGKKRIPRTPKKLAHKIPPHPVSKKPRVIDFGVNINPGSTGDTDVIAVTEVVMETPPRKMQMQGSNFQMSHMSTVAKKTQSPYNSIRRINSVIISTPVSIHTTRLNAPFSLRSPDSNSPEKEQRLKKINEKLESAGIRHENIVQEQQERVARDNEERKRRVNLNLQQKKLEEKKKVDEIRAQQERVRQLEKAQRSPKTTKASTPPGIKIPATVQTPSILKTPGQRAVPQKRQKQFSKQIGQEQIGEQVQETSKHVQIKSEDAYEMTPDKVPQPSTEDDYNVIDLSSGDETDNEDNPRKQVPRWAEKDALRAHCQSLFKRVNADAINAYFGFIKAPKINVLFANSTKNYTSMMQETSFWNSRPEPKSARN